MVDVLVGIDIGGSHIGYGFLSKEDHCILYEHHEHLDHTFEPDEILNQIITAIRDISSCNPSWKLVAAGIGCPGHCKNGILMAASNLPTFKQVPLAAMVSKALNGITTVLLNDADAAIAAEVWGNESKSLYLEYSNMAMITIGTGIGLGLILNGNLYRGTNGLIEGGHMIIASESWGAKGAQKCNCGQYGCVEMTSSAKMTAQSHGLGTKEVFERAVNGDDIATAVLEQTAEGLAIMCINICRVIDPDVIIFAGGMSQAGNALIQIVRRHIDRLTWTVLPTTVKLVTAHTVERAGVVGAALAADQAYNSEKK